MISFGGGDTVILMQAFKKHFNGAQSLNRPKNRCPHPKAKTETDIKKTKPVCVYISGYRKNYFVDSVLLMFLYAFHLKHDGFLSVEKLLMHFYTL